MEDNHDGLFASLIIESRSSNLVASSFLAGVI